MRVVTTSSKQGFQDYGYRWLEGRANWPANSEFIYFTEGFGVDCPAHDLNSLHHFQEWKKRYVHYVPPSWRYDIVRFAHKVFAAYEALRDYDGIGVWLDADCVTFDKIPAGLIEAQVATDYIALYQRTGHYSETGFWIVNCAHPHHKDFFAYWMMLYQTGHFTGFHEWHDCTTLDGTIKRFVAKELITVKNLSGEHSKTMHPQAVAEPFCRYISHHKGNRKIAGISPENQWEVANRRAVGAGSLEPCVTT